MNTNTKFSAFDLSNSLGPEMDKLQVRLAEAFKNDKSHTMEMSI